MCFKSSSSTKSHEVTDSSTTPRYGQTDEFRNFAGNYNKQWSPENIAATQDSASINPYTTEAAARQAGIQPVLASTMDTTSQMSRDGLTEADINRYQNPYVRNVVNPMMDVFNQQNRAALNNIGGKMAAQGAIRNTGMNTAKNSYYSSVQPGQNMQLGQLYANSYDNAVKSALSNIQAKLSAAGTTGQLSGAQTSANQAQFNMGDALRNAELQKSMLPYQIYNMGLAGQQTMGNMYGVDSHLVSDKNSTTTNSPSPFSQIMGGIGAAASLFGGPAGTLMGGLMGGTSVQPGTPANGGWTTTTTPNAWPFAGGGKVVARGKAGGGGVGQASGLNPGGLAQQVAHFADVFSGIREKAKARGGAIGKAEGGPLSFDEEYGADQFSTPLGGYTPPSTFSLGPPRSEPPRGQQFGPPAPEPVASETTPAAYNQAEYGPGYGAEPPERAPATPATPFVQRQYVPPATTAPPYRVQEQRGSLDSRGVLEGGLGRNGGFGGWLENAGRVMMAMGPPETQRGADMLSKLNAERLGHIGKIHDDEKTYADATGLYRGLKTLAAQKQEAEVFNQEEQRRLAAFNANENQKLHGSTMALQDVQTRTGEENVPSVALARRMQEAEQMGLIKGTPEYLDYVSDGKYSAGKGKLQETALDKQFAEITAKDYAARSAAIASSQDRLSKYAQVSEYINNPAVAQGAGAGMILQAKKIGQALGMTGMDKDIADAEVLNKFGNEFALSSRSTADGAGMPGAMSDADRVFLTQSNIGLTNSQPGNQLMVKIGTELEKYKIASNLEAQRYIDKFGTTKGLSEYMTQWQKQDGNRFVDKLSPEVKAAAEAEAAKNRGEETTKKVAELAALAANAKVGAREVIKTADGRTLSVEKMADGRWRPLSEQEAMTPPAKPGSRENPRKYGEADSEKGDYVRKDGRLQRRTGNVFFDRYEDVDDAQGRTSKP